MIFILNGFSLNKFRNSLQVIFDAKKIKYDYVIDDNEDHYNMDSILYLYVEKKDSEKIEDILESVDIGYDTEEIEDKEEFLFIKEKIIPHASHLFSSISIPDILLIYKLATNKIKE